MKLIKKNFSIFVIVLYISIFMTNVINAKQFKRFDEIFVTDKNGVVCTSEMASLNKGNIMWFPESMYKSNKRLPVLVWANGTVCPPVLYYEFLSEVAAAGYIVVANTELFAGDGKEQKASIDFIISEDFNPESVFYGKVDETRIGVMGHSQGGLSSVNCANDDERVKCVLSIAGNSSESCASKLEVPTFFVTGSNDFIVLSSLYVEPSFNSCKSPAVFGNIKGAIHTSISFKPTTYSKYAIKWFDIHLKNGNKEEFKKQLLGDSEWSGVKFKNF